MEKRNLPVYKLRVSDDDSSPLIVDYIGLVDDPAMQLNWVTFEGKTKFSSDKERRIVMGPLIIANMPIYRRDEKLGEYYVKFEKEEIQKIAQRFKRNKLTSNFNIMHDPERKTEGVYLLHDFPVDASLGISAPEAFKDISDGSLIGIVKVDNEEIWNNFIKTGELKGFSIEGLFSYEKVSETDESLLEEIIKITKGE